MYSIHITKKKSLRIVRKTGFLNLMLFAERMNLVGFLNSMHIAAIRLNHL